MIIDDPAQEGALAELIERYFRTSFTTENALITDAVKRMLGAGGKRIRPRLTLIAVEACGSDPSRFLHLAAYMELIHVATLIHDDVVDRADTRRGINSTAVDFGNRTSVLAGDYLFAWIFKNVTANYAAPIPHVLSKTLAEICDGEVLQLQSLGKLSTTKESYVETASKKTASLFAAAAECGAIAAAGNDAETSALRLYGEYYGIAFQMVDDLLDLIGDSAALGKPVGNDLAERKMTIPLILALERAGATFKDDVRRLFEGETDRLQGVIEAIDLHGGIAATRTQIAEYADRAKQAVRKLPESEARSSLIALAEALVGS